MHTVQDKSISALLVAGLGGGFLIAGGFVTEDCEPSPIDGQVPNPYDYYDREDSFEPPPSLEPPGASFRFEPPVIHQLTVDGNTRAVETGAVELPDGTTWQLEFQDSLTFGGLGLSFSYSRDVSVAVEGEKDEKEIVIRGKDGGLNLTPMSAASVGDKLREWVAALVAARTGSELGEKHPLAVAGKTATCRLVRPASDLPLLTCVTTVKLSRKLGAIIVLSGRETEEHFGVVTQHPFPWPGWLRQPLQTLRAGPPSPAAVATISDGATTHRLKVGEPRTIEGHEVVLERLERAHVVFAGMRIEFPGDMMPRVEDQRLLPQLTLKRGSTTIGVLVSREFPWAAESFEPQELFATLGANFADTLSVPLERSVAGLKLKGEATDVALDNARIVHMEAFRTLVGPLTITLTLTFPTTNEPAARAAFETVVASIADSAH